MEIFHHYITNWFFFFFFFCILEFMECWMLKLFNLKILDCLQLHLFLFYAACSLFLL
jgi:hypothetical protein